MEVALKAAETYVPFPGGEARLLTYSDNGSFPGPAIRARRGDLLKVRLRNALPFLGTNILGHDRSVTNLHTHGLHVSPMGDADNVMLQFHPGDEFLYQYDLRHQAGGTLNFYHPHVHGTVAEQYWGGLVGPLIVEDEVSALAAFEEHVLVIKDIALANGAPTPYTSRMDFMHGKEGDTVTVNGQIHPVLQSRPGQVQRWRVLNACNARYLRLRLESHAMYLVGTDGGLLDRPYRLAEILLAPGERADLLVKAGRTPGRFRLQSVPYSRGGMSALQTVTLLSMEVGGSPASDALPSVVDPGAKRLSMDPSTLPRRQIVLSMGQGRGYINGVSFEGMERSWQLHSVMGTYEVWEIVNQSGMDHPFHQHVNAVQVLSVSGGDPALAPLYGTLPAWKDTVNIPKWGKATLLVPIMDYDGMTMFHCHIVEHEDIGMMGVWHIGSHGM